MSVKILLDPVLTAQPLRCSTNIQYLTWVKRLLFEQKREDVFFYWMVADWVPWVDGSPEGYPVHQNIKYLPIPQSKVDRTKEYFSMNDALRRIVAFNGDHWDWDIMVTVRAGMVPAFRLLAMSPKQATQLWSKEFWVLEQMPLMSFKKTVAKIDPVVQDRYTLLGYQTADHVLMMAPHEEIEIFKTAREHLVPSAVVEMKKHFRQVIPLPLPKADLLAEERMFKGDGQFCLAYVGRFPRSGANLDKIYEVMTKSWIMRKGESVRLLCMSNKGGGKMPPPKHMEVKIAGREEFWHTAREEMHLIVMMHEDAEFHMSLMEPMSFGVPAVLLEKPWAVSLLGPDYPFYAKGVVQAYAIVKQFYDDYAGTYAKFRDWHVNWFQPTYERRYAKDMMYPVLDSFLADYEAKNTRQLVSSSVSTGDIVQLLAQSGDELLIKDGAKKLPQEGKIVLQSIHFDPDVYNKLATTWSLSWNSYRLGLKALGYVDASTTTGHMRRVKS